MMRLHDNHEQAHYNEVIVDTATYAANLPASLAAIFILDTSDAEAAQHARQVHEGFLRANPTLTASDVPLLRLRLHDLHTPFVIAS